MRKRRGFTLIELMIVIAIIAILAAVLVPNFMRIRRSAQLNGCMANTKNLATLLENYNSDHGGFYPQDASDLSDFASGYVGNKVIMCPGRKCGYDYGLDSSDTAHYTVACSGGLGASNFYTQGRTIESADIPGRLGTIATCGGDCSGTTGTHSTYIGGGEETVYPATDSELGTGLLY